MFRWTAICVALCALTVGAVYLVSNVLGEGTKLPSAPMNANKDNNQGGVPPANADNAWNGGANAAGINGARGEPLTMSIITDANNALDFFAIPGGRVQTIQRQEVGAQEDGPLVYLATDTKPGESVPEDKKLIEKCWMLAIKATDKDVVTPNDRLIVPDEEKVLYRKWKPSDGQPPARLALGYEMRTYRKLVEGDTVEKGQLVALIDNELQRDDLRIKISKLDVAQAELQTSTKTKEEAKKRYDRMIRANERTPGSFAQEEVDGAVLTWQRYMYEEQSKAAALIQAQREVTASQTILNKHEIRAEIAGVIKVIYKRADETVKKLDPVLQIQNLDSMRVELLMDVQNLHKVVKGQEVTVEPTVADPPDRILRGHLQEVHAVAVSKARKDLTPTGEPNYTIVSASEDRTARGWDLRTGKPLWILRHPAAVRSVACTGEGAERSLALIGTGDGSARLLDLDEPEKAPVELSKRHQGAVLCVAFSPDGKMCATSGEDRTIYLWDTATGELLKDGTILNAHQAPVTSLQFASNEQLASAGRDNSLNVWSVKQGDFLKRLVSFDRRGGEVQQLGVSPDGKQVLFDQGKELRVLSIANRQLEGLLQNYGASANFTTMALFAPDGNTILTASEAESRLQLWRKPTKDGRAGELRQFIWTTGPTKCGAFAPNAQFAVTGTQDNTVLIWKMPSPDEINERVTGRVSLVDPALDSGSSRQVRIWVDVDRSDKKKQARLIPGSIATVVLPPPTNP
jgi:WD40 repeat protein